jgi:hypothetical protein
MKADEIERSGTAQRHLDQMPGPASSLAAAMKAVAGGVFGHSAAMLTQSADAGNGLGLSRLAQSTVAQARVLAPLYRAQHARDADDETAQRLADALVAARATASRSATGRATVLANETVCGGARSVRSLHASWRRHRWLHRPAHRRSGRGRLHRQGRSNAR